ncbi:NOP protein chaperone 1 [Synchiropus picturatus]
MESNSKRTTSQDLLTCGSGAGLKDKLLLKPATAKTLQTERVPQSSVLSRLQSFLPQMAEANERLKQQIAECPNGQFDIECVEDAKRVIEMDVALVELSESESDYEDSSESSEDESSITEQNLKLPGHKRSKNKPSIQVVDLEDK